MVINEVPLGAYAANKDLYVWAVGGTLERSIANHGTLLCVCVLASGSQGFEPPTPAT